MNNKNIPKRCFYVSLFVSIFLVFSTVLTGCSKKESAAINNDVKILVLDDCSAGSDTDEQSKTDEVLFLDSKGELLKKISGFRVKSNFNISKAISVSPSGRYFAVCENAINKLSIYETSTGREYWSQTWPGKAVTSALFSNDKFYAFGIDFIMSTDENQIGKKNIEEIKKFWNGVWFDIALDENNKSIWAIGMITRKYNFDFEQEFQIGSLIDYSAAGSISIDIASDGYVWVAAQDVPERNIFENNLMKISPDGNIIKNIELEINPYCVCVDKTDDSVWVTGIESDKDYSQVGDEWPDTLSELNSTIKTEVQTYTHKYNSNGDKILELEKGGYSIVWDKSDKSVWVACHDSIVHYSSTGDIISEYKDVSSSKKWIALVK